MSGRYVCPGTRTPLRAERERLVSDAGTSYPVIDGIPSFLRFAAAEDAATSRELERLNRLAREQGWAAALQAVFGGEGKSTRYLVDAQRGSFVDLLALTADTDVFELGPGLGQLTVPLARAARSVHTLEVVHGNAQFTLQRCRQEGLSNVDVAVGGDDCRLPYADRSFDCVVLNLVFEWCALRCVDEPIEQVQRRLLSEVRRILRPGGQIYLATKNRFALRHLIGKRDPHCFGLPFGSALPRWLGRLGGRLKGEHRPRGMLHSHNALRRMLGDFGFAEIESFWAAPEMRYPSRYIRTDAASIRAARRQGFVQGESRSTALLMRFVPAPLVKHVTPGLAFRARLKAEA